MLEAKSLAQIFAEQDAEMARVPTRYPVLNTEPREQMGGRKWHLIMERDGPACWMCATDRGPWEIDHLLPRSSFMPTDLLRADRSDNLRVACLDCNQKRSNYDKPRPPEGAIGVTNRCWVCTYVDFDPGDDSERWSYWKEDHHVPEMTIRAYCGFCGYTAVPDVTWLL